MTAQEFINKWRRQRDSDGSDRVGIVINWDKIPLESTVIEYAGKDAWTKISEYSPPWHLNGRMETFKNLIGSQGYLMEIEKEKTNERYKRYESHGLEYPNFCVFANSDGTKGIVGDGNHRFIDCRYLMDQGKDLSRDIDRCTLDVICLTNLSEVIQDSVYPNY